MTGGLLAWLAGALAAVLHLAGALKTTPALSALPFDITLVSLALLLPLLALLLVTRRWAVAPALALPVAAAALLWLWLVVAGSWSASRLVLAQKLPEVAIAAPLMLVAGLLVGAEPVARAALCRVTLGIGLLLGLLVGWSALAGWQAQDLAQARVHHQLAGLALASAAALAALAAVEARGLWRLAWLAAV
ncbi:MAG: O-antigen ligase domain-containing protein, partial [Falsiroseomonas sp.]|nr:O-antigen ligase domain-containing protein [Falsiroseomonas sp.]